MEGDALGSGLLKLLFPRGDLIAGLKADHAHALCAAAQRRERDVDSHAASADDDHVALDLYVLVIAQIVSAAEYVFAVSAGNGDLRAKLRADGKVHRIVFAAYLVEAHVPADVDAAFEAHAHLFDVGDLLSEDVLGQAVGGYAVAEVAAGLGLLFKHRDLIAIAAEEVRARKAGGTGADDRDALAVLFLEGSRLAVKIAVREEAFEGADIHALVHMLSRAFALAVVGAYAPGDGGQGVILAQHRVGLRLLSLLEQVVIGAHVGVQRAGVAARGAFIALLDDGVELYRPGGAVHDAGAAAGAFVGIGYLAVDHALGLEAQLLRETGEMSALDGLVAGVLVKALYETVILHLLNSVGIKEREVRLVRLADDGVGRLVAVETDGLGDVALAVLVDPHAGRLSAERGDLDEAGSLAGDVDTRLDCGRDMRTGEAQYAETLVRAARFGRHADTVAVVVQTPADKPGAVEREILPEHFLVAGIAAGADEDIGRVHDKLALKVSRKDARDLALFVLHYLCDLGVGYHGDVHLHELALERQHDLLHAALGDVIGLIDLSGYVGVDMEFYALVLEPADIVGGLVDEHAQEPRVEGLVGVVHGELDYLVGRDVEELLFLYVRAGRQHAVREHGVAAGGVALFYDDDVQPVLAGLDRCGKPARAAADDYHIKRSFVSCNF